MSAQSRIAGLDIVRCAAIFLVVLQHSWTMLDMDLSVGSVQHSCYSSIIYGVALFVMISGALNLRHTVSAVSFYKRRFSRVLLPFFIWGTVTYVISSIMGKYHCVQDFWSGVRMYLPFLFTGKINQAYWFVYLICALYLVTPLLQYMFCREGRMPGILQTLAVGVWIGIETLVPPGGIAGIFVHYLGYFLSGALVSRCLETAGKKPRIIIGCLCFAMFYLMNIYLHASGHNSFLVEYGEVMSLFVTLSSIDARSRFSERLSRYSYFIYLTHFILIGALYVFFPRFFYPEWYMPAITALVVINLEYMVCRVITGKIGGKSVGILGI